MMIQWEPFNFQYNTLNKSWEPIEEEGSYDDDDDVDLESFFNEIQNKRTVINTPAGLFDVIDPFAPHNRFEIWQGYTDFNVSKDFITLISKVEGIEMVIPTSRYSFMIGIGKLFNFRDIRFKIELECGVHDDTMPEVKATIEDLKKKNDQYFVYVYPDGTFNYSSQSEPDFKNKLKEVLKEREKGNGSLIRG